MADTVDHIANLWRFKDAMEAPHGGCCAHCGETFDDQSPNIEAFELCDELVCDECAEAVFEDNAQLGVGA